MRLLCASLCLAATTLPAWAATPPSGKAQTPKKETRTTAGQQASTTGEHLLLADRLEIKNRLSKEKQRREADLKAKKQNGDTVRAAFSGKVRIKSYEGGGYGNYVVIRHPNGLETVYGHMSRSIVREGTVVRAGDPIGLGGSTGRSTGPHLHFEARFMGIPIDPSEPTHYKASPLRAPGSGQ